MKITKGRVQITMKENLKFITEKILSSLKAQINWTSFVTTSYPVRSETETENGIVYNLLPRPLNHITKLEITARYYKNTVVFSIEMQRGKDLISVRSFRAENGLEIKLCQDLKPDKILSFSNLDDPFWVIPKFISSVDEIEYKTQNLVMQIEDKHYHLLPLCGEDFRCELGSGIVYLSPGCSGRQFLKGDFLAVTVADDPFEVVKNGYENAKELGAINIPLADERKYPEVFESFGWCTWDSFYQEVSSEKIFKKLDEFKENNIPVKWMIIDDGWSKVNDKLLLSFEADKEKFPEGLGACIAKIKKDYGVEKVGVWHSYLGYWFGVDPQSELYKEQKDNLVLIADDIAIPALDEDKAFAFWDTWHTYLRENGVDFLKIDNQSSISHRTVGLMPTCKAARISHRALERSVVKNFGGALINCMGMNMENVLARPVTKVSRNSGDYYPQTERHFVFHVVQNVYNTIWHSMFYNCDFDMWWSKHETAVQSGTLRAISGSLIYVSDAVGKTDREKIMPTIEDDGTIIRCDLSAKPTRDCFYTDCRASEKLLKIWNRKGDDFAAVIYNIGKDDFAKVITDTLDLADIPGADDTYIAYDYFNKTFKKVKAGDKLEITLDVDKTALYNFYKILSDEQGEYIMLGNTDKYVSIATREKTKTYLAELV